MDIFLQVQFEPTASALQSVVTIAADTGLTAMLQCQFTGIPDNITWFKDDVRLQATEDTYVMDLFLFLCLIYSCLEE